MEKNLIMPAAREMINALAKGYLMHPMGNDKSTGFCFNGLNLTLSITGKHWIFVYYKATKLLWQACYKMEKHDPKFVWFCTH